MMVVGIMNRMQSQPGQDVDTAEGNTPPPPLSHDEAEMLSQQWQQRLAGAAQQAEIAGKLSGNLQRLD